MPNQNTRAEDIDLIEYLSIIKKRWKYIVGFVSIVVVITTVHSFRMPKFYQSEAVIMPVGGSSGAGLAGLGTFGGIFALAGLGGGGQTVTQQFMALLKSRTLAEDIINRYDLMSVLAGSKGKGENTRANVNTEVEDKAKAKVQPIKEGVIMALLGHVSFREDVKTGVIKIAAEFTDPKLAADIANAYVEGLQKTINDNSLTSAKRYRVFMEKQLEQNKRELLEAGKGLNEFYKSGKVSSVESTVDVSIKTNYNGQIINEEEANSTSLFAQVDDLQKQKQEIESKYLVKGVPQQVYLQYLTIRRNLLVQINTLLAQQYEMAKMEEAKEEPSFQIVDSARVPETRSKPNRKKMVVMAFVSSLFIGIFAAFFVEWVKKIKQQKKLQEKS